MLENTKAVYIIGIGGISLSALAIFLKEKGKIIYGSDIHNSKIIETLREKGINITIGHSFEFVKTADIIVYSSAVSENDCDLLYAKKLNKKIMSRAQLLGEISNQYKTISISGTHGKTTTTGMIASVFLSSNHKPNIHIGGILNNINSNIDVGDENIFITEACEYKDSFLYLNSYISVVLNIKPDHLDYFKNFYNLFNSFQKFCQNTNKNGCVLLNNDDKNCREIVVNTKCLTFAIKNNAFVTARNIVSKNGKYSFDIYENCVKVLKINLPCYGKHNIYNALAAYCVCKVLGFKNIEIKNGIENFKGIKRRFEFINEFNNNLIIHDYAHHPDEIKEIIKAGRLLKKKKVIVIFQPHTYTRTRDLYFQFLNALCKADEVWLLPIYPAREKAIKGISSYSLFKDLKLKNKDVKYFSCFERCKKKIMALKERDLLIEILGAGDINLLAESLKNEINF